MVDTETRLLRDFGHEVDHYFEANDSISRKSLLETLEGLVWSPAVSSNLADQIGRRKPDIVHFHNIHYRISPSAFWVCRHLGIPVVATLHNFRYGCLNARLTRDGQPCRLCLTSRGGGLYIPGIKHGCFQGSRVHSTALAGAMILHRMAGTYSGAVNRFIALSRFALARHLESGLPPEKLVIKPNCAYPDPGMGNGHAAFALFVGRLEVDKGITVLLKAAAALKGSVSFIIAGEGPMEEEVRAATLVNPNITYLGVVGRDRVFELMRSARLLLFPSLAYENFPLSLAEAMASGLPAIVSGHGAAREIVDDGETGLYFAPGSAIDLIQKIEMIWDNSSKLQCMRRAARAKYEEKYSGPAAHRDLMAVYHAAISDAAGKGYKRRPLGV